MTGPAIAATDLDPIDAMLISHYHHGDNLDSAGRALLPAAGAVLTTTNTGAGRLGGSARGLQPWPPGAAPARPAGRVRYRGGQPGQRLGVARVTARLPIPLLAVGVRLVDPPGVGSVYAHNTRATDAYLPSLDAAVLVTSADPPISGAERAFLERVTEHAVRLFVVLNKADYLAAEDLEGIVAFTERVVREVLPDWPGPAYPLSARPGVGDPTDVRRFADDLARFSARSGWRW